MRKQGNFCQSEALLVNNLCTVQKQFGSGHDLSLNYVNELALIQFEQGKVDEAEHLFRDLLNIMTTRSGTELSYVLKIMNRLAAIHSHNGQLDQAEQLFARCHQLCGKLKGHDHRDTLSYAENLATLIATRGRSQEAEALMRRVVEGFRSSFRAHPEMWVASVKLWLSFAKLGRADEGYSFAHKAVKFLRQKLGNDHSKTVNANQALLALRDLKTK